MRVVLIYSGGIESFTLLHQLLHEKHEVTCLSFDYGQRHNRELTAARFVSAKLNLPHSLINLQPIFHSWRLKSALTNPASEMPHGHYAAENMKQTVVPGRNTIMLSVAMAFAEANAYGAVAYAAHAGDHHIYPDCRPAYIGAMRGVFYYATEGEVILIFLLSTLQIRNSSNRLVAWIRL